jgi:hypothetical protein
MKRTVLLSLAGALVLAGSAATAAVVLEDDDVTVSASCVPIMDTDRDKAGLVDHIAVLLRTSAFVELSVHSCGTGSCAAACFYAANGESSTIHDRVRSRSRSRAAWRSIPGDGFRQWQTRR